jgi:creatinine amidohydrolase/Fe(II)-dependent formamide hydrolase-like protein
MESQDPSEGKSLDRLPGIKDSMLFTGFSWYADYPAHIAGDPTLAKKELGELIFGITVSNTVDAIKAVKADKMSEKFVKEFAEYSKHPNADLKHS